MAKNKIISVEEFKKISSSRNEGCAPIWSLKVKINGEDKYAKKIRAFETKATKSCQWTDCYRIEEMLVNATIKSIEILGVVCDMNLAKRLGLGF